jgi:hypothetical protein
MPGQPANAGYGWAPGRHLGFLLPFFPVYGLLDAFPLSVEEVLSYGDNHLGKHPLQLVPVCFDERSFFILAPSTGIVSNGKDSVAAWLASGNTIRGGKVSNTR